MARHSRQRTTAEKEWRDKVYRTTKCFSPSTNGYPGGFPIGFVKYLQENGWWGEKRAYLCAGGVQDPDAIRVDIRPDTNPTHCEDARNTSLPPDTFDVVIVDPPYSRELAAQLYDTAAVYSSVNVFLKEAARLTKPGGLVVSLSYEVPRRIPACSFIAIIGAYQAMNVAKMRCLVVARKELPTPCATPA